MKKAILFVMILGLCIISVHSTRAFDSKGQPKVEVKKNCTPLVSVDVTLTNKPLVDPCSECPTWYIYVEEWDGGSNYVPIGGPKSFDSGPTYTWTGLNWDYTNYPCLVLVWHYVNDQGAHGCGYSTPDKTESQCWTSNPPSTWQAPSNFYPCQ